MWKKSLLRGLSSYCISATVYLMITAVILLCGAENACMPEFIQRAGSVQLAVCLHPLLIALIGFAFGAGSVLWSIGSAFSPSPRRSSPAFPSAR